MRRFRRVMLAVLAVAILTGWLWWVRPKTVDMAGYAPTNSLLYVEANRPLEVVEAIVGTQAWSAVENILGNPPRYHRRRWFERVIGWTGIGPIQSVILARAQLAAVVTELGTTEEGDALKIKPEGAIIIETHTSESRIRRPVELALKRLAEATYKQPIYRKATIEGVEFIEWSAPEGSRQIVATIVGSLVIVGNNERAVQSCLGVSLRGRPSLKSDPELNRMRFQLAAATALTFGYVPSGNSARLLAVGVPLILGRAPGDSEFQRLITRGAERVFGSLGWSSKPYLTGIEDRYLISLQPSFIARIKPNFSSSRIDFDKPRLLPADLYSVTYYRFAEPAQAWQSIKTAVSSQVDALSAIVFSSLLKAAILSYGIDEPERFLGAVDGEVLTIRLDQNGEHAILVAAVRDNDTMREIVTDRMGIRLRRSEPFQGAETIEDSKGEFSASLTNGLVVLGSPPDVRRYAEIAKGSGDALSVENFRKTTFFGPLSNSANIITYTNDSDRIRSFVYSIAAAKRALPPALVRIDEVVAGLPFAATETTLGERGLERVTRSPLGQFSTLLPLLIPDVPASIKTEMQSR